MENWLRLIERSASQLEVGGFRPSERPEASSFGRVTLARPGEAWPIWQDRPLLPLCQLNISEAPFAPENIRDLSLIAVFVAKDFYDVDTLDTRLANDGSDHPWCIRAYARLDGLVTLTIPEFDSPIRPFEARWRDIERDYPTHDLLPVDPPPEIEEDYYDIEGIRTLEGTKLGGWPLCIQSEPWWDHHASGREFEYALQVDSEEKAHWMWGDRGAAYFARSKADPNRWAFDWQCY